MAKKKKKVVKKKAVKKAPVKKKPAKKAKVKNKIANKKNTGYRQLKDGTYRIHGWRVVDTPSDKFPELVSVESKKWKVAKRFITFDHAVKYIEFVESEGMIDKGKKQVVKELKTIALGPATDVIPPGEDATKEVIASAERTIEEIEVDADQ